MLRTWEMQNEPILQNRFTHLLFAQQVGQVRLYSKNVTVFVCV